MKWPLLIFIISHTLSFSQEVDQNTPSGKFLSELVIDNPQLKRAMGIVEVGEIYQLCFNKQHEVSGSVNGSKLMDCLWNGDSSGIQGVTNLPEVEKKVLETMSQGADGKARNIASVQYEKSVNIHKKRDPALKALEDYYSKRLEEALYGGAAADAGSKLIKTKRLVDQGTFYQLYKSQLGKNIIATLSSYCLDAVAVSVGNVKIPLIHHNAKDRITNREMNLKTLQVATGETLQASSNWGACIQNIQHVCHLPEYIKTEEKDSAELGNISFTRAAQAKTDEQIEGLDGDKLISSCKNGTGIASGFKLPSDNVDCHKTILYSQERACVVTQYITEAKKNMGVLDKTIDGYKKLRVAGTSLDQARFYKDEKTKKSIDDLTSITSQEVFDSSYGSEKSAEQENFKECYDSDINGGIGGIVDANACKKFLNNEKEKSYAALAEFKLKQEATLARLKEIKSDDKEQIKALLVQDGYTNEEAEKLSKIADIKAQIDDKYEQKKDALIRNLAKQIDELSTTGEEFDAVADLDKIKKISDELKNDTKHFAQLVHFNNIVSSYLEIDNGGEKSRNTASISRELEQNAFTQDNIKRNTEVSKTAYSDIGISDYNDYKTGTLASTNIDLNQDSGNGDNSTTNLDIRQINQSLLNFFIPAPKEVEEDED